MTKHTDAEIEAAAKLLENLLDELDPASVVVVRRTVWRDRPRHRGGYPSGSNPVDELRPPPASITRPTTDADDQ